MTVLLNKTIVRMSFVFTNVLSRIPGPWDCSSSCASILSLNEVLREVELLKRPRSDNNECTSTVARVTVRVSKVLRSRLS